MRRGFLLLSSSCCSLLALGLLAACSSMAGDDGAASSEQGVASGVHVTTSRNDLARTSHNAKEKILTTSNVNSASFGRVWARTVDGQIYAQPLYVGGVNGKNVVFVATEHNSVYAFDADSALGNAAPIWKKNLGPSVPAQDTGCGLLSPEIGITSTPVIDLTAKTIWVSAKTKENGGYVHRLHALDIETGDEQANSPVVITASAPGNGAGSVGGILTMDPLRQMNRPGLTKVGNTIYLGFASNCDIGPYHGWVLAYDATTMQQTGVHVDTPGGSEGGIWHAGVGLAADSNGDVFYVSGNGSFDGTKNFGNSVVRLHQNAGGALAVASFFTPFDSQSANADDDDLGSTGGLLIPGTDLLVTGDKRGLAYLVDKNNLGGIVNGDTQIAQRFQATTRGMYGGGAYYKRAVGGTYYLWGTGDRLKAYTFDGQTFDTTPQVNTSTLVGYPGGQLSISSDGDSAGTAIVWGVRSKRTSAGLSAAAGPGVLEAFDADDITQHLYSSDSVVGDSVGSVSKFAPPTIANGRVYVGTSSNEIVAYGLRAGNPVGVANDAGAPEAAAEAAAEAGAAPTWTQLYNTYFAAGTAGHCSGTGGCHTNTLHGFKCGANKNDCYSGLVSAGLVTPGNPAQSPLGDVNDSPLAWVSAGGTMPLDNPAANAAGAAAVQAWINAGAPNN